MEYTVTTYCMECSRTRVAKLIPMSGITKRETTYRAFEPSAPAVVGKIAVSDIHLSIKEGVFVYHVQVGNCLGEIPPVGAPKRDVQPVGGGKRAEIDRQWHTNSI